MKSLNNYLNECLIFELSDELLKRAADAARERGTAIEKRRAKEFENWLNNPERKKIQELSGKSKYYKMIQDVNEKYLKPAISAYENHETKETQSLLEDFYYEIQKILSSIETSNIQIIVSDDTWYEYRKPSKSSRQRGYGNFLSTMEFSFKPHWKKGDDTIFELGPGLKFKIKIKNANEETLNSLGYSVINNGKLLMNIYKDGSISAYIEFNKDNFLPSDFENDVKELLNIFDDLGFNCYAKEKYILGKKSLKDTINVGDFFTHLSSYEDFTKYNLKNGLPRLINKIENFFKTIDSSSKIEWINKEDFSGGLYSFTAKLKLTYKGKDYELKVHWEGDYQHTSANIKANDEQIFNLDYKTTHWDAGLSSNEHYQEVSDEINNIFK